MTVKVTSASVRSLIRMPSTSPTRTPATRMSSPSSRPVTSLNTARYVSFGAKEMLTMVAASRAVARIVTSAKRPNFTSGAAA